VKSLFISTNKTSLYWWCSYRTLLVSLMSSTIFCNSSCRFMPVFPMLHFCFLFLPSLHLSFIFFLFYSYECVFVFLSWDVFFLWSCIAPLLFSVFGPSSFLCIHPILLLLYGLPIIPYVFCWSTHLFHTFCPWILFLSDTSCLLNVFYHILFPVSYS